MVMELEQLINQFKKAKQDKVAKDLNEVLEKHRDSLPAQLPQEELILEDGKSRIVITKQMVENPDYLHSLLDKLIYRTPDPIDSTPTKSMALRTRTINKLRRYANPIPNPDNKRLSLSEFIVMSDDELLGIRQLGLSGLRLFRAATLPVKEKFFGQTI